jgi:diguanylate cyclase (GGDEF)-like protein
VLFGLGVVAAVLWVAGLVCFVTGAYRFFSLARRERFVGALLIGVALTTVPVHTGLAQLMMLFDLTVPDRFEVWIMVYALLALGMHLLIFEDITYELRHQNAALSHAQAALKAKAMTDPLTGCYNRRFFDEVSAHELDRHRRYGLPLSLLFVDCDRFKSINDAGGHETGDRVLDLMAALLREHVRQSDYVFRWGGDEFLVMIACDEASAADKAKQIQQAFSKHPLVRKLPEGVALSVGLVTVPHDATDLLDYVGDADRRMYEEKTRHATGH